MGRRNVSKLLILTRANGGYRVINPKGTTTPVDERLGGGRLEVSVKDNEWRLYASDGRQLRREKIGRGHNPDNYADGVVGVYRRSSEEINDMLSKAYEHGLQSLPSAD